MLELRFLRENIEFVKQKTAKRGLTTEKLDEFIAIDKKRLAALSEVESLKNARNTASKEIAKLKQEEIILTTEKDYVRLQPELGKFALYYLPIKTVILNGQDEVLKKMIWDSVKDFQKN